MSGYRFAAAAAVLCVLAAGPAQAVVLYNQNVTPDILFGSGNANGDFTVDRSNGVELGLRGKLRFDENDQPQNIFNSNGDGTYSFNAGTPTNGFSFAPEASTPVWSFEWSVNSNFDGSSGNNLSNLTYLLEIDFDPGIGTDFLSFDPINVPLADHAIGNNATLNGDGQVAADPAGYAALIAGENVAQNSWSYVFFDDEAIFAGFDPQLPGIYTISLTALDGNTRVANVSIDILVAEVPEPASAALLLAGLGGLGLAARRRRTGR